MKERFTSGKTDPENKSDCCAGNDSKKALAIMDGYDCWPEHQNIKKRLDAGTIGKEGPEPCMEKKEQPSAAARLLESANIGCWPENDQMKETMDAGKMFNRHECGSDKVKTHAPIEWPCNDALKSRMEEEEKKKNDSNIDNDNKIIAAQLGIFDEDEPFDGNW